MASNNSTNSGGPSVLTLIQSQTVSSIIELDFTTGITPSYNNYLILTSDIVFPAAVSGDILQLQVSIDGGLTYDTTNYTSGFSTFTTGMDFAYAASMTAYVSCSYYLSNVTSGSGYIIGNTTQTAFETSGFTANFNVLYDGYNIPNSVVNAIRFVPFSGSAFSGNFSLYGYSF